MPIQVDTKDCTALSDAEMGEMADICADGPAGFEVGLLSKQREEWVLVTQARDNGKLLGYSFCTLERIGGTPCLLVGLASVKRHSKRETVLKAMMTDQYRRAVLAFPDEDVLVGTRLIDASGYLAFRGLEDIVPRPDHKATGEERAWSRRLAKRFGAEGRIDDRTFVVAGDGSPAGCLDHEALKPEALDGRFAEFVKPLNRKRGDQLIAFGWAMAEDLAAKLSAGK
ncbi:MAG: hypothetical protein QOF60_2144 [Actinomycetota bacterium]|jgi:hypothetical protein|nr:hypothetical protein [Actinomycetota bacterium]